MMIKKILFLVLGLILILQIQILAEEMPTIEMSASQAAPGQTVEMALALKDNPGIVSMILSISYDNNAMKLVSVEDKKVFGKSVHGNDLTRIPYILCWANDTDAQNYEVNGTIAVLKFAISQSAVEGSYPVTINYDNSQFDIFDVNLNVVYFEVSNGMITVVDSSVEDSNNNSASSNNESAGGSRPASTRNPDDYSQTENATSNEETPKKEFEDVHAIRHWATEYVDYVYAKGIMKGTGYNTFSPNVKLSRAMLVTMLYRLDGEPPVDGNIAFKDIEEGSYYEDAVAWAYQNGIVNGVSDVNFAPSDNINREQIATIMHRYAQYKGYDVSVGEKTSFQFYEDFDSVSEYAVSPVQYAVNTGLMKGKTDLTINPKDSATRAEAAAIFQRFAGIKK